MGTESQPPIRRARCLIHHMARAALVALIALTCNPALVQPPALRVAIRCDADGLRVGDEVPITFIVTNVGGASFDYGSSPPYRFGALEFGLQAFDELQRPVIDPQSIGFPAGGIAGSILSTPLVLGIGDSFEETLPLNEWASAAPTGAIHGPRYVPRRRRDVRIGTGNRFDRAAQPLRHAAVRRRAAGPMDQATTKAERDQAVRRIA